jgi:hypothetical protein
MDQRPGDGHFLFHPLGERVRRLVSFFPEPQQPEQAFDALLPLLFVPLVQPGVKVQVPVHAQAAIETDIFRDQPDHLADLQAVRLVTDSIISDPPFSAGLGNKAAEHPDRGGLPCPVGAQKAEDLSLGDVERQVVDRGDIVEFPGEVLRIYQNWSPFEMESCRFIVYTYSLDRFCCGQRILWLTLPFEKVLKCSKK